MGLAGKILVLVGLIIIIHAGYSSEQCKYEHKLNRFSHFQVSTFSAVEIYSYFIFVCR